MKVATKDFTEKGNPKRYHAGDVYTGTRAAELEAKGLLTDGEPKEKEKKEFKAEPEKVEVKISTKKVKK